VPAGSYVNLNVQAVGTPPLLYQWFLDGQELAGATNRQLVFNAVQRSDAGKYTVKVQNYSGSDTSLPAKLDVLEVANEASTVWLQNWDPFGFLELHAPVFEVDGTTRLAGTDYLAQLYAGPSLETLRPCGEPTHFEVGFRAGAVAPRLVTVPHVPLNTLAYGELRCWQADKGASYEEARALGGRFGKSATIQMTTSPDSAVPSYLFGLQSFSLRAGLPQFNIGELEPSGQSPEGATVWQLRGEKDARYLIEKSETNSDWRPLLLLVTSSAGVAEFVDPTEGEHEKEFYRARILD
jgi:hypothetical protein